MEDVILQQVTATSTVFLLLTDESPAKLEPTCTMAIDAVV